jgi:hypothetical protein
LREETIHHKPRHSRKALLFSLAVRHVHVMMLILYKHAPDLTHHANQAHIFHAPTSLSWIPCRAPGLFYVRISLEAENAVSAAHRRAPA